MEYDERKIVKRIEALGWLYPKGLDANSTNCLLNSFANEIHIEKHGFHPYAFEISGMVRTKVMSRDEGIEKIYQGQKQAEVIESSKKKLGLK